MRQMIYHAPQAGPILNRDNRRLARTMTAVIRGYRACAIIGLVKLHFGGLFLKPD